ncbi:Bacterial regulatory proteins, luxR family [Cedecea davisae]|uniref:Transcriptional regulator, LuxR family n=1 Tax=Cedecea davisae DSM 4568 TaxID=566551 RepID=S3IZ16_9ENTR|nr:LuxR C-terminal-related transcriptional regulator [Cedecea davisae]EPF17741.1 transcriptional regulator, LuxR family [Cedecea davisae DSM 4568]SUX28036.1 Bacterial regulatory proteins, luxR family [Cedecea davisae]
MCEHKGSILSPAGQANVVIWGEYAAATGIRFILEELYPNETIAYVSSPDEIKDEIGLNTRLLIGVGQSLLHGLHAILDTAMKYPKVTQLLITAAQGQLLTLLAPGIPVLQIKSPINEVVAFLKKRPLGRNSSPINEGFLRLTQRQQEVFYLLIYGKDTATIGRYLGMSVKVVSNTKMMIMKKMNIEHRGEMLILCSMLSRLPQQQWRQLVKYRVSPLSIYKTTIKHFNNHSLYSEMSA